MTNMPLNSFKNGTESIDTLRVTLTSGILIR